MEKKGGEKGVKIAFWNVIGRNKDKDFWASLKRWAANVDGDMGGEEEIMGWNYVRKKLSDTYGGCR